MPQLDLGKIVGDPGPQGPRGLQGIQGVQGPAGPAGEGVPTGGNAGEYLRKLSGADYDTDWEAPANNLTETEAGKVLDARQGKVLSDSLANTQDAIAIVANGDSHAAIHSGYFVIVRNHSSLADGLYKATETIATNGTLSTSNLTADVSGGLNALKADVDTLNSKFTTFNFDETKALSTSWSKVKDIEIPANTVYGFEARQYFSNVEPQGMAVSLTESLNAYSSMIVQDSNGAVISFTGYNPSSSPIHLYIFAKAGGSGTNGIIINGWFRSM